jgi:protein O-mannosyl-transferase
VHPAVAAALIAVCVAIPALRNGFALDDVFVIAENSRIHSLVSPWRFLAQAYWPPDRGTALYRPLTVFGFALQWAMGGGAPLAFHIVSMLLSSAVTALVGYLALALGLGRRAALVAAVLFAVHPVHVEAVANIVGQGELLAGLGVLGALVVYVRARHRGRLTLIESIVVAALYAAGCLAKENAIVLPALLVVAELALVQERPLRERLQLVTPTLLGVMAVAVVFLTVRSAVLGGMTGTDTHPVFHGATAGARALTTLGLVPTWLRLFLFPLRLQADYSPAEYQLAHGLGLSQFLGAAIVIGLGAAAWRWRRDRPVIPIGILVTAIALLPTSNLLLPTGVLVAERTLFLPSVGVVLVIAAALEPGLEGTRSRLVGGLVAAVAVLGGARFMLRTPVWASTEALSEHMLDDAPNDYRSWWMVGGFALRHGDSAEGEAAFRKAVKLYDGDPNLMLDFGNLELVRRRYAVAESAYSRALVLEPAFETARNRRILSLVGIGRCAEARAEARHTAQFGDPDWQRRVAFVDSVAASPGAHCDYHPQPPAPQPPPTRTRP